MTTMKELMIKAEFMIERVLHVRTYISRIRLFHCMSTVPKLRPETMKIQSWERSKEGRSWDSGSERNGAHSERNGAQIVLQTHRSCYLWANLIQWPPAWVEPVSFIPPLFNCVAQSSPHVHDPSWCDSGLHKVYWQQTWSKTF